MRDWTDRGAGNRCDSTGNRMSHPHSMTQAGGGIAHVSYLDDGWIFLRADLAVPWLESFDARMAETGGSRNRSKTKVIFYASDTEIQNNRDSWSLDKLERLASVCKHDTPVLSLGGMLGGNEAVLQMFSEKVKAAKVIHSKLASVNQPQIEHVLARFCVSSCKVTHQLRLHGESLIEHPQSVRAYDELQKSTLDRLFPGLDEDGYTQAGLSCGVGGLGLRHVEKVALPACIASRIASRPKVSHIAQALNTSGLISYSTFMADFDGITEDCVASLERSLDNEERSQVRKLVEEASACYEQGWINTKNGNRTPSSEVSFTASWTPLRHISNHNTSVSLINSINPSTDSIERSNEDASQEDPDVQDAAATQSSNSTMHLQKQLSLLLDNTELRRLVAKLFEAQDWPRVRQLQHLRSKGVSHAWLWHVCTSDGAVMNAQAYVLAVRKRLGCQLLAEPVQCHLCGKLMDTRLYHAECCAVGEATIGHYKVCRKLYDGVVLADSRARTETRGLCEASDVRPADIYTSAALPGREAALDVTVVSPEASRAGQDCLQTAYSDKIRKYRRYFPELNQQGIAFRPLVWSTEGAPHPVVLRVLSYVCEQAVQRNSCKGAKEMQQRWQREISIAIQTRKAAMIAACIPRYNRNLTWLLCGNAKWAGARMQ